MIGIIDYGMGNLRSVQKALEGLGKDVVISSEKKVLNDCSGLILPGVGAFPDAMKNLRQNSLDEFILDYTKKGNMLLGICLGMQLLFKVGYEFHTCEGLGLLDGSIEKLTTNLKIPHMGWNNISICKDTPLLAGIRDGSYVYFVHSFYANMGNTEDLNAYADYGQRVTAVVSRDNVYGTQFHPEKSGDVGIKMLSNFAEMIKKS